MAGGRPAKASRGRSHNAFAPGDRACIEIIGFNERLLSGAEVALATVAKWPKAGRRNITYRVTSGDAS